MNQTEDLLQGLIEQLENGEAVEVVAADLPADEAEVIRLIAALRQTPAPPEDEALVAAQEAQLLAAASRQYAPGASAPGGRRPMRDVLHGYFQEGWAFLQNNRELALGLAALIIIIAATWMLGGRSPGNADIAGDPAPGQSLDASGEAIVDASDSGGEESAAPHGEAGQAEVNSEELGSVSEDSVAEGAAVLDDSSHNVFLPQLSAEVASNAKTAVIEDVTGLVQVQTDGTGWRTIGHDSAPEAGGRIRTGDLSRATLTFHDGSQAHLGANTELSIDQLNAQRPEEGFRTVVMTQWLGESEHEVDHRGDSGSLYEVKTAEGSGIARGTRFQVIVTPDLFARYIVSDGKVDVTSFSRTVAVTAGQLTTLLAGSPPDDPSFTISGQGRVSASGSEWTIAGQSFSTHPLTLIVGNPQVGDLVYVEGHLLDDGGRVADRIILLRRAVADQFSLSGEVGAMGAEWQVAGQAITITPETVIDEAIQLGDNVRVAGIVLEDGTLQAQRITRLEAAPGLPFQFSGVVQAINPGSWRISGQTIAIDGETEVDPAVSLGSTVAVEGWIIEEDVWLAREISLLEADLPTFEFTGLVSSIDPWVINGIPVETRDWTTISPGLGLGDEVRVEGTILSDGSWVADSITRRSDSRANIVLFRGVVNSIDPWIVNGLPLDVTGDTDIQGSISPGMQVIVAARLLPDGRWTVLSIRPLYPNFGVGCLLFNSPILAISSEAIQVKHWRLDIKRDGRIKIRGNLKVESIISLPICTGWDGTFIFGDIIVIYEPIVIIINPGNDLPAGCRLTSKGSIKCSERGSSKKS